MEVYAGLFLVTIGIGYLVTRVFQSNSVTSGLVKDKEVGSTSALRQTRRNGQNGSIGLASSGSHSTLAGRTMTMASRRPAFVSGTVQKPWGW